MHVAAILLIFAACGLALSISWASVNEMSPRLTKMRERYQYRLSRSRFARSMLWLRTRICSGHVDGDNLAYQPDCESKAREEKTRTARDTPNGDESSGGFTEMVSRAADAAANSIANPQPFVSNDFDEDDGAGVENDDRKALDMKGKPEPVALTYA